MSSIINKSKWIVTVKRRPDLTRAFPHYKGAEASTYKQQLLSEDMLVAEIARGPLKLFVRIRTRGRASQYLRVHSYEEAEALDTTTRADQLRGVAVNTTAARRSALAHILNAKMDTMKANSPAEVPLACAFGQRMREIDHQAVFVVEAAAVRARAWHRRGRRA